MKNILINHHCHYHYYHHHYFNIFVLNFLIFTAVISYEIVQIFLRTALNYFVISVLTAFTSRTNTEYAWALLYYIFYILIVDYYNNSLIIHYL